MHAVRIATKAKVHLNSSRLLAGMVVIVYLFIGGLYAFLTPPWQVPDEPAHFNYVRAIWQTHRLPTLQRGDYDQAYLERIKAAHFPSDISVDSIRYEAHQPPLYYVGGALLLWPLSGADQQVQLHALRFYSLLLSTLSLWVAYRTFRLIFPWQRMWAVAGIAFIAFVPQHLAMMAGVNNDALAEFLLNAAIYFAARFLLDGQRDWKAHASFGIVVAAIFWTKTTAYVVLPAAYLAWLVGNFYRGRLLPGWRVAEDRTPLCQRLAWGVLLPLAAAALWFGRNVTVYGAWDILGLARHGQVVIGQPRTADFIVAHGWPAYLNRLFRWTFHSFWGQFGWMGVLLNSRFYGLFLYLSAVLVIAGSYFLYKLYISSSLTYSTSQKMAIAVAQLSGLGTIAAYLWYNVSYLQTQGRYLFPALLPWALIIIPGLWELLNPELEPLLSLGFGGGSLLALISSVTNIFPLHRWDALLMLGWSVYFLLGKRDARRWRKVLLLLPFVSTSVLSLIVLFRFILPALAPL